MAVIYQMLGPGAGAEALFESRRPGSLPSDKGEIMGSSARSPEALIKPRDAAPFSGQTAHNIDSSAAFYEREAPELGRARNHLERVSRTIGPPVDMSMVTVFVLAGIRVNASLSPLSVPAFNPAPFARLQGFSAYRHAENDHRTECPKPL